jgi:RNA polymerase sigma-70 factor (ECF subfamily)
VPDTGEGDFELLERWRIGDRAAGSTLFARYFERVYAFFEGKVPSEAEDLTQRTFEACVETRDRYRGDASFRSYLFGIARIQLLRWLQRGGQRPEVDAEEKSLADLGVSPSREVAHRQRQDRWNSIIGTT